MFPNDDAAGDLFLTGPRRELPKFTVLELFKGEWSDADMRKLGSAFARGISSRNEYPRYLVIHVMHAGKDMVEELLGKNRFKVSYHIGLQDLRLPYKLVDDP